LTPGGEDQFACAAARVDSLTQRLEVTGQRLEVIDISIETQHEFAIGAEQRLGVVFTDEATVGETDAWSGPDAAAAGPAVRDRIDHGAQPRRIDRLGDREMECACNARHW
jgi:hypothetical protein